MPSVRKSDSRHFLILCNLSELSEISVKLKDLDYMASKVISNPEILRFSKLSLQ